MAIQSKGGVFGSGPADEISPERGFGEKPCQLSGQLESPPVATHQVPVRQCSCNMPLVVEERALFTKPLVFRLGGVLPASFRVAGSQILLVMQAEDGKKA